MLIDFSFPKSCESCLHGDSITTHCYKKNRDLTLDQYNAGCNEYKNVVDVLNEAGCPKCGKHGSITYDVSDEDYEQDIIECGNCGLTKYGDNRPAVLEAWMNMKKLS